MDDQRRIAELEKAVADQASINEGVLPESGGFVVVTPEHLRQSLGRVRKEETDRCAAIVEGLIDRYGSGPGSGQCSNGQVEKALVAIRTGPAEEQTQVEALRKRVSELESVVARCHQEIDWYEARCGAGESLVRRVSALCRKLERLENP